MAAERKMIPLHDENSLGERFSRYWLKSGCGVNMSWGLGGAAVGPDWQSKTRNYRRKELLHQVQHWRAASSEPVRSAGVSFKRSINRRRLSAVSRRSAAEPTSGSESASAVPLALITRQGTRKVGEIRPCLAS